MKIETATDGQTVVLRLVGSIESMYLDELQAEVRRYRLPLVLDLDQVTLVDVGVVRFLIACEAEGIELLRCAPYIRSGCVRTGVGRSDANNDHDGRAYAAGWLR